MMMRGMGRVFRRKESTLWWVAYCQRGKEIRESSGSPDRKAADRLLKRRLQEIGADRLGLKRFVGPAQERVTFEDLATDYLRDCEIRRLRSLDTIKGRLAHLRAFFGLDRAVGLTTDRIRAYQAHRLEQKAKPGTVNRETAALARMFRLAEEAGRLSSRPVFPERLVESPPRQGFFEHADYVAIREHLPGDYQDVLDFGYYSGWRKREILGLEWREVDLAGGTIRLSPERAKTRRGRALPLSPPLRELLARRLALRRLDTPLVFHRAGNPIKGFRKAWATAAKKAGLPGKLFHDLRRTAIRNMIRAGVPERVAMEISGHKTRSVFDRYNIVSEEDLRQAAKRLADYVAGQPTTPVVVPLSRRR